MKNLYSIDENDMKAAKAMWFYAIDYIHAAKTLDPNFNGAGSNIAYFFIVCHSYELLIKSYLVTKGIKLSEVQVMSHNLDKLTNKAKEFGLLEKYEHKAISNIIIEFYKNQALKYPYTYKEQTYLRMNQSDYFTKANSEINYKILMLFLDDLLEKIGWVNTYCLEEKSLNYPNYIEKLGG